MSSKLNSTSDKSSRSAKIRKYMGIYERVAKECKSRNQKLKETGKTTSTSKVKKESKCDTKKGKKQLNEYQLFVREESSKSCYKNLSSSERMSLIGDNWRKKKRE